MTSVEENILKNLSVDCVIFGFKNQVSVKNLIFSLLITKVLLQKIKNTWF